METLFFSSLTDFIGNSVILFYSAIFPRQFFPPRGCGIFNIPHAGSPDLPPPTEASWDINPLNIAPTHL